MTGTRFNTPVFTALDANGDPIPVARLYFYENNTNTPLDVYSDVDLTTSQAQPVEADGAGRFTTDIFMDNVSYRVKLTDAAGSTIWVKDDCNAQAPAAATSFPFVGAVVEFYGTQAQVNIALSAFWYIMDGNNSTPNLDGRYTKACISIADVGTSGGSTTPTGAADSHVLTIAEMPIHKFLTGIAMSGGNPAVYSSTTTGIPGAATAGVPQSGTAVRQAYTEQLGSDTGHTHTLTMNTFDPEYFQMIKLLYIGS